MCIEFEEGRIRCIAFGLVMLEVVAKWITPYTELQEFCRIPCFISGQERRDTDAIVNSVVSVMEEPRPVCDVKVLSTKVEYILSKRLTTMPDHMLHIA